MIGITESAVEEAVLEWFEGLGYTVVHGPDIAVDEPLLTKIRASLFESATLAAMAALLEIRDRSRNVNALIDG